MESISVLELTPEVCATSVASLKLSETETNNVDDILIHHGTKGMHWGVRQYQNADGSLTPMGRLRYGVGAARKHANKAAAATAEAIRKRVKPTQEEQADRISAKLAKQKAKNAIEQDKIQLKLMKGKKVDISKLSDEQLAELIQRKNTEERYKELLAKDEQREKNARLEKQREKEEKRLEKERRQKEKEEKKHETLSYMAGKAVKESLARAMGDVVKDAVTKKGRELLKTELEKNKDLDDKLKYRLNAMKTADEITRYRTKEGELERARKRAVDKTNDQRTIAENQQKVRSAKGSPSEYDKAKKQADLSEQRIKAIRNEMEARAYGSGEDANYARELIREISKAKKSKS